MLLPIESVLIRIDWLIDAKDNPLVHIKDFKRLRE